MLNTKCAKKQRKKFTEKDVKIDFEEKKNYYTFKE